jgi:hypothetical protein
MGELKASLAVALAERRGVMIDGLRIKVWCKKECQEKDCREEDGKKEIKEQIWRVNMPAFSIANIK